ncbi:MAG: cytochrome c-type biogenesis protein CcmF [Gammaproteobacteria bacterium]|jgi:cytochrome c-type biogenesis protein CcmF
MIPELGHFALILALCLAVVQTVIPFIGAHRNQHAWMAVGAPAVYGQTLFHVVAFAALVYAFVVKDFSVLYVATNSNAQLPLMFRISAVWGAHEGSLLLWSFVLSIWTLAVALFSKSLPAPFQARVLSVMGFISIGFLLFMLLTSNPFERLLPAALSGQDLNPLLQDFGLIVHPPMLYMGYVGLAVPFAFAIAALIEGRIDAAWTRWTRPWTVIAWVFLTFGIALGSWWAYYELGWGGWWFWDPVENASFMPWLVATALIHSLAVTEKRDAFRAWTVLLAVFGFSLSLLGTFLVRSGVLVSVHAFASDPERGVFVLGFLVVVIGGSLCLYAMRASQLSGGGRFDVLSRETLLLVNNVLLVVAMATILMGTLYPLISEGLGLGKISVGAPYFAAVFVPLTAPLFLLVVLGPIVRWKRDTVGNVTKRFQISLAISLLAGFALVLLSTAPGTVMAGLGFAAAAWVTLGAVHSLREQLRNRRHKLRAILSLPRSYIGMSVAHLGLAVFVIGVTAVNTYSIERDVRMAAGETQELAGYTFTLIGVRDAEGPNFTAKRGEMRIEKDGVYVSTLHPEKRFYPIQGNPMTEAGIDAGLTRDLYVSLGEALGNNGWAVRIYYKPFIRWIWLGALVMGIGGLIAVSDSRYRVARRVKSRGTASRLAAEGSD